MDRLVGVKKVCWIHQLWKVSYEKYITGVSDARISTLLDMRDLLLNKKYLFYSCLEFK